MTDFHAAMAERCEYEANRQLAEAKAKHAALIRMAARHREAQKCLSENGRDAGIGSSSPLAPSGRLDSLPPNRASEVKTIFPGAARDVLVPFSHFFVVNGWAPPVVLMGNEDWHEMRVLIERAMPGLTIATERNGLKPGTFRFDGVTYAAKELWKG